MSNPPLLEGRLDLLAERSKVQPPPVGGSHGNLKPSKATGGGPDTRGGVLQSDPRIRGQEGASRCAVHGEHTPEHVRLAW